MTDDTFIARGPDGERVELRVKRDDDDVHETGWYKRQAAIAERQNEEHVRRNAKIGKSFDEVMADRDASEDPQRAPAVEHHASRIADLLVEAGHHPNRRAALDHLLHSARGAALLRRLNKSEDNSMQHTTDTWQTLAKDFGVIAVAKHVVDNGAGSLGEHEFTQLLTEHAKREHPDMTPEQAFEKVFSADDESGKLLRQAHALTKAWPAPLSISPVQTPAGPSRRAGSSPPRQDGTDRDLGDASAYAQLQALAESQRRAGETAAQAFARIYAEPANRHLVDAERAQNRPDGGARVVG